MIDKTFKKIIKAIERGAFPPTVGFAITDYQFKEIAMTTVKLLDSGYDWYLLERYVRSWKIKVS